MPIPVLIWALAAGGAAFVAWQYRKEIEAFFNSETGQSLMNDLKNAGEGYVEPYRKILEEAYTKTSDQRKVFFSEAKKRMSSTEWAGLMGYARSQKEAKYVPTVADLFYVENS